MEAAFAPNHAQTTTPAKRRPHRQRTLSQAREIQAILHRATRTLGNDFECTSSVAERKDLLPFLAKATDAWSTATAVRQDAQGRPRAGSLSPAERAAMRQRKSQRSQSRAPTLAKPAAAAPSVAEKA